jgi:DNA modification methylase
MAAVHAMDIPTGTNYENAIDFPGSIIQLHEQRGFDYAGRHVVWKEPLEVRNRTMLRSLHHKTLCLDSMRTSLAHADYVLRLRRAGTNKVPVTHERGLMGYAGERRPPADILAYRGYPGNQIENQYSQWCWRQYASSVWDDIRSNNTLTYREAREEEDEAHVHPLQLDVITRCLALWTNPDEIVLSPFAGVGSEVYAAILAGRRAIGIELKASYFHQAVRVCAEAERRWRDGEGPREQGNLFGDASGGGARGLNSMTDLERALPLPGRPTGETG